MREKRRWLTTIACLGVLLVLPHVSFPLFGQEVSVLQESQQPLVLETILMGLDSAYPCRFTTLLIIRGQEDWQSLWNLHQGREAPHHQLPDVDFDRFSVIALFAGRSSLAEGFEIVRVDRSEGAGRVTVHAVELEAGLGCTGPRILKNPFHMVRVPLVDKQATLSLEIELLSRHCAGNLNSPR